MKEKRRKGKKPNSLSSHVHPLLPSSPPSTLTSTPLLSSPFTFSPLLSSFLSPLGAVSDSTHSLRFALQMTWIGVLVSGLWWGAGYYFLPPLLTTTDTQDTATVRSVTYCNLLCGADPVKVVEGEGEGEGRFRDNKDIRSFERLDNENDHCI